MFTRQLKLFFVNDSFELLLWFITKNSLSKVLHAKECFDIILLSWSKLWRTVPKKLITFLNTKYFWCSIILFSSTWNAFSCNINFFMLTWNTFSSNINWFLLTPDYFLCNVKHFVLTQTFFFRATPYIMLCHADIFLLSCSKKNVLTCQKKGKIK